MFYHAQRSFLRLLTTVFIFIFSAFATAQTTELNDSVELSDEPAKANSRPGETAADLEKQFAEEIDRYEDAISSAPEDAWLRYRLGTLNYLLRNYEEAAAELEKAVALKPDYAAAFYNLSIAYDRLRRYSDSLATVQKSLALGNQSAEAYTQECQVFLLLGRNREAVPCYENLLEKFTPTPINRINYGIALTRDGQIKKALAVLEKTTELYPDRAKARNAFAMLLFERKKYRAAAAEFARAVELEPDFHSARFNLAVTHLMNNKRDAALKQYRILLGMNARMAKELFKYLYRDKILFVEPENDRK